MSATGRTRLLGPRGDEAAKRAVDLTIAVLALVLTAPLLAAAMLAVLLRIGAPVLFVQERTGRHGRPFRIYKLRTMTDDRDADGELLPDAVRCPPTGRLLRRLSIDELPQLWNVLRGDLSLVGPRPLVRQYDPWYTERERQRFLVRPGLTGLVQISGRNGLTWDERLELDVRYVRERSLGLDLRILLRTARAVLVGTGASATARARTVDLDAERRAWLAVAGRSVGPAAHNLPSVPRS
ncbi:sugar transferase [Micromonospora sediminicola]|uniref:sugar transferase n=1 Tax=Micromonospora sediminicola TaxID=946078 RepID=UPI0033BD091B